MDEAGRQEAGKSGGTRGNDWPKNSPKSEKSVILITFCNRNLGACEVSGGEKSAIFTNKTESRKCSFNTHCSRTRRFSYDRDHENIGPPSKSHALRVFPLNGKKTRSTRERPHRFEELRAAAALPWRACRKGAPLCSERDGEVGTRSARDRNAYASTSCHSFGPRHPS